MQEGDVGLVHRSRGCRSCRAFSEAYKQTIIDLYRQRYAEGGFGPTLASEKLEEEYGYVISRETLRLWLHAKGLWSVKTDAKISSHDKRFRYQRFGEFLQLDGSIHPWLQGCEDHQCLMNMVDDATSTTLSLMDKGERTEGAFRLLKAWIERYGVPLAIYVDLKSLYISPKEVKKSPEDKLVEPEWVTQFGQVCRQLGIRLIEAGSAEAKGKVERSHQVYQDRFMKEMYLQQTRTIKQANELLNGGFIDHLNAKFSKPPYSSEDAHIPLRADQNLETILGWTYTRTLTKEGLIRFQNELYKVTRPRTAGVRPREKVTVKWHLDGTLTFWVRDQQIDCHWLDQTLLKPQPKPGKSTQPSLGYSSTLRSQRARQNKHKTPWSKGMRL